MSTPYKPSPTTFAALIAACSTGFGTSKVGNQVYVIEVNDNPSIDAGVEDKYLGKALYELIMQEFADRLERRGR